MPDTNKKSTGYLKRAKRFFGRSESQLQLKADKAAAVKEEKERLAAEVAEAEAARKNGEMKDGKIIIMAEDTIKELKKWVENKKPLGEGSFKKAYIYNEGNQLNSLPYKGVLTHEIKIDAPQPTFLAYREQLNFLYNLTSDATNKDSKLLKRNLLLPEKLGQVGNVRSSKGFDRFMFLPACIKETEEWDDNGSMDSMIRVSDAYDYVMLSEYNRDIRSQQPGVISNNLGELLRTVYLLHQANISCLDIKLANTFMNCGNKNLFALGDVDGFTVFKSQKEMYSQQTNCVATFGYRMKNHLAPQWSTGGPITDWYAILWVVWYAWLAYKGMDQQKYDLWPQSDKYSRPVGPVAEYGFTPERKEREFVRYCNSLSGIKEDTVSQTILNALVSCGRGFLQKPNAKIKPVKLMYRWDHADQDHPGDNYYIGFIQPIIDALKESVDNRGPGNDAGSTGGRKRRTRRRSKRKRKRTKKRRRRKRKRTKKRRRRRKR